MQFLINFLQTVYIFLIFKQLYYNSLIIKQKNSHFMRKIGSINQNLENPVVKQLKQKLHKSFMELSNMEQLCRQELQTQKQHYENVIQDLKNQNLTLKAKLKQFQPINSDKTEHMLLDIDQSIIMNKKTSKFIQDESFIDLMKGTNINDICQYMIGLEKEIKKELKKVPAVLTQYFENCQVVARESSTFYEDFQKSREKIQRMQIEHNSQIRNINLKNEQQIKKLKEENKKLRTQKDKIYLDYEKLNALYQNQLIKLQALLKEKKMLRLNNSSSLKDIREVKNEQNDSNIWCSRKTTDSEGNSGLVSPKFFRNKAKKIVGF